MEAHTYLENHEEVIDAFGYWPTFHDAEIHKFILDRTNETYKDYYCPCIEFVFHTWEMTSDVDDKGYYKLVKHHLVTLRFEDVYDLDLDGFNNQNAILSLDLELTEINTKGNRSIVVTLDPAYGLGAEFKALTGRVINITPCNKHGKQC